MKKTYQSPEALIIELQVNEDLLLSTSETTIEGNNGGWVKEESTSPTNKSIWDDEW